MRHAPIPQIAATGVADAELVARALARDEAAIRSIMQANNRRLYRLARGILRNDAGAGRAGGADHSVSTLGAVRGSGKIHGTT